MAKIFFVLIPIICVFGFSNTSSKIQPLQVGDTTITTDDGFIKFITPYRNGLKHGTEYRLYQTGDTMEIVEYKMGVYDGKSAAFYEGNRLAAISYYKQGCSTGEWQHYDTMGMLQTKTIYDKPFCPNDQHWSRKDIYYLNGQEAYNEIWKNARRSSPIIHNVSLYKQIQDRERPLIGQKTFNAQCASCHAIKKELVGPALAVPVRTRSQEWLMKFIRKGDALYKAGDTAAKRLYQQYYMMKHPDFSHLTKKEIEAIVNYIKEKN